MWLTPPHILAALGRFDVDPCACMAPRPWSTADRHFTREDDGMSRPWYGRVWLNPPYGPPNVIAPWMRRMAEHQFGTALIFARTDTAMFHQFVFGAASAVLFLRGRLFFCRPDGVPAKANSGAPSALVAYGDADAAILEHCHLPGHFMRQKQSVSEPTSQLELVA